MSRCAQSKSARFGTSGALILLAALLPMRASALDVVTQFKSGEPSPEVLSYATVLGEIPPTGIYLLAIDDRDLERLRDQSDVEFAEPNERFHDLNCSQSVIWMTDFAPAASAGPRPPVSAARLALLDGAIDSNHVSFQRQLAPGRDLVEWDEDAGLPAASAGLPEDQMHPGNAHATATAGAIAAVAPDVWIVPYRVLDESCTGSSFHLARAMILAVDEGARVLLMPVNGDKKTKLMKEALEYAKDNDVVVVVSAGNTGGMVHDHVANDKSVLAVAAVDDQGSPAPFSSYGPKVGLSDYGVRVETAYPGGRRVFISGTSFAAARTAAAAAALRTARPEYSAKKTVEELQDTAAPLGPRPSSLKKKFGEGITDLTAALD